MTYTPDIPETYITFHISFSLVLSGSFLLWLYSSALRAITENKKTCDENKRQISQLSEKFQCLEGDLNVHLGRCGSGSGGFGFGGAIRARAGIGEAHTLTPPTRPQEPSGQQYPLSHPPIPSIQLNSSRTYLPRHSANNPNNPNNPSNPVGVGYLAQEEYRAIYEVVVQNPGVSAKSVQRTINASLSTHHAGMGASLSINTQEVVTKQLVNRGLYKLQEQNMLYRNSKTPPEWFPILQQHVQVQRVEVDVQDVHNPARLQLLDQRIGISSSSSSASPVQPRASFT